MKTMWLAGVAVLAFSNLAAAQSHNENWMKQKLGRTSQPQAGTVINSAPIAKEEWVASSMQQHLKAKTGRYSPPVETRIEDYRSSVAARVDPSLFTAPKTHIRQHLRGKLGR